METYLRVLSDDERDRVHESTIKILSETGVRVETELGRSYFKKAGAQVDETTNIVRIPRELLEWSLQAAPKDFSLGARRPGWDLKMNAGECSLIVDGEGVRVLDRNTGDIRPSTATDWLEATLLIDALDEVGVYWAMAERGTVQESVPASVDYWIQIFRNFSKHVQDASPHAQHSPWLLEILQIIFGDKEAVRQQHPFSFLICPQSPLTIEGQHTDAYLALRGWDIPAAVMPMPLMGGTGPGSMISMTIQGNCEVLAMLCLIQAAEPGTPFIYAPVLGVMNPWTGLYSAGAIENALLSSAVVEMARYYRLPVEASGGGTDTFVPGIQTCYERATNLMIPLLSWPDLMVGCGLMGGSMILSLGQLVIDTEVFRMGEQAHRGIQTHQDAWLEDVIHQVGPGGNYLGHRSTVDNMRSGEWLIPGLGAHDTLQSWERSGRVDVLNEARERVEHLLQTHKPLPLGDDIEAELKKISQKAQATPE